MFIYSIRAKTLKFIAILVAAVAVMATLVVLIPDYGGDQPIAADGYRFDNVGNLDGRIAFFDQFNIKIDSSSEDTKKVAIPNNFDAVFIRYNEIQKSQGLDLSDYKRKSLTRYTYTVISRPDTIGQGYNGKVLVTILVYRGKVVAADVCSSENGVGAFVSGVM